MKPIRDIDDPRLAKALSHPLRVAIIAELEQRSASSKQLAEKLGARLENLSYHVRTLRDLGLIELERTVPVRGSVESYYRAAQRIRVSAEAWERMPSIHKQALMGQQLDRLGELVAAAAQEDGFARPESHASRRPLQLDERGFREASAIVSRALDELSAIETECKPRIRKGAEEVPTTAIALLFQTAAASPSRQAPSKSRTRRRATASS